MLKHLYILVISVFFFSCNSNSTDTNKKADSKKQENINQISLASGGIIEVMDRDLFSYVNSIEEANMEIKNMTRKWNKKDKDGWRLPSYDEILAIAKNKDSLEGFEFEEAWYLTSNISKLDFGDIHEVRNVVYAFSTNKKMYHNLGEPMYTNSKNFAVRPVRTIK
jgi:hypothetical protein